MNVEEQWESEIDNMRRTNLIKSLALVTALMLVTTACGKEKLIGETSTPNTTTVSVEEKTVHQTPEPNVITVSANNETEETFDNPELIGVDLSVDFYGNEELTYMPYEKTLYCHKALNVRDMPNTSGNKVGSIKVGEEVHVIGIDKETGWYLLENGNYCSNEAQYLKAEKYVKPTTTPSTDNSALEQAVKDAENGNGETLSESARQWLISMGINPDEDHSGETWNGGGHW